MAWREDNSVYADDGGDLIDLNLEGYGDVTNAYGSFGNDVIIGNHLNNLLAGNGGDDQLWGGTGGGDILQGGAGHDMYWWGYGDGSDVVSNDDNSGDCVMMYNVRPGYFYRSNQGGNLHFDIGNGNTLDLAGWYNVDPSQRVQNFIMNDNTVHGWNNGEDVIVNLSDTIFESDQIRRAVVDDSSNSLLIGGTGDDWLQSGNGNSIMWGGYGGADTLVGGAAADIYWFGDGDGTDMIASTTGNQYDVVQMYNVTSSGDVAIEHVGNDLRLTTPNGDGLTIRNWYMQGSGAVNRFQFADGSAAIISDDTWLVIV